MNREIKFRGLSENEDGTKDWVYGYLGRCDGDFVIEDEEGFGCFVYERTIGEYTGCKDANGKEIYEGDIIRLEGVDDREIGSTWEHIGKIVYKRGAFFVCYFDYYADGDEELICDAQVEFGTVIGNVYENKNLLEEE